MKRTSDKLRYQTSNRLSLGSFPVNRIQPSSSVNANRESDIATRPMATIDSPVRVLSQLKGLTGSTLR
jgi:hypothetical protein